MLDRRQGSGTFLVRPPDGARLRSGLEKLETYTVHAERLGVRLSSEDLRIEEVGAGPDEIEALEGVEGAPLVRVSRVLLMEGSPAAWMVDFVPADGSGTDEVRTRRSPAGRRGELIGSEGVPLRASQALTELSGGAS